MPGVRSIGRRTLVISAGALAGLVLSAGVAAAHVTIISPDQVTKGGDAELVLRVPNEEDSATVTKVELDFPQDTPLSNASPQALMGWSFQVNQADLKTPVKMASDTVTNAVTSIVWTPQPGSAIPVNAFQSFPFWTEGLPTNTDTLVFKAIETYSNGKVVTYDQKTGPNDQEPDNPAPELTFTSGSSDTGSMSDAAMSDTVARWLGGAGVVLAAIALGFGLGALTRARRARRAPTGGVSQS